MSFFCFRHPGKKKAWTSVKLKDLHGWLAQQGFHVRQCTPGQETDEAFQDLEQGYYTIKAVPHYSLLVKKMELLDKQHTMTLDEYEAALKEKPSEVEVLVRKMDQAPDCYDPDIWGPFPEFLWVLCMKIPSQNQKVDAYDSYKTVFLCLSPTPNTKLGLKAPLSQLWMWKCGTRKKGNCNCSRLLGSGPHVVTMTNFVFCYETYPHKCDEGGKLYDTNNPDQKQVLLKNMRGFLKG